MRSVLKYRAALLAAAVLLAVCGCASVFSRSLPDDPKNVELFFRDPETGQVTRLTRSPGFDGEPALSPDGRRVVFTSERDGRMDLYIIGTDGRGLAPVTLNGAANRHAAFHPVTGRIVFSTTLHGKDNFELYACDQDGSNMLRLTRADGHDIRPAFSADGRMLSWQHQPPGSTAFEPRSTEFVDPLERFQKEEPAAAWITARRLWKWVDVLSSDEMRGRMTGSPELARAADRIEQAFRRAGAAAPPGGFRQRFRAAVDRLPGPGVRFGWSGPAAELGKTWQIVGGPAKAECHAGAVFAGYGVSGEGYDDYAGLEVKGKVVFCLRFMPAEGSDSPPLGTRKSSRKASLLAKANAAAKRGAAAVVFITGPHSEKKSKKDRLLPFGYAGRRRAKIPMLHVTRAFAESIFKKHGRDLGEIQKRIDESRKPASFACSTAWRGSSEPS